MQEAAEIYRLRPQATKDRELRRGSMIQVIGQIKVGRSREFSRIKILALLLPSCNDDIIFFILQRRDYTGNRSNNDCGSMIQVISQIKTG